jgi:hypothetical protein
MGTKWLGVCAVLGLAVAVAASRADEASGAGIARLGAKAKELRAENKSLRPEVAQLKDEPAKAPVGKPDKARLDTDLRLLLSLDKALNENPNDRTIQQDAAALAARLAPDLRGNPLIWRVLLKTRTLKDGMSLAGAEQLLGPPTEQSDKDVGWYFNPDGRLHVAPCLHAKVTKEGLAEWKIYNR